MFCLSDLFQFSIILSQSIHVVADVKISFSFRAGCIPLCLHLIFICSPVDGTWVTSV